MVLVLAPLLVLAAVLVLVLILALSLFLVLFLVPVLILVLVLHGCCPSPGSTVSGPNKNGTVNNFGRILVTF